MIHRNHSLTAFSFLFVFFILFFTDCPAQAGRKPASSSIQLLSPGRNAYVTVTNKKIQTWWDQYEMNKTPRKSKMKEYSRPEPLVFKWKKSGLRKCSYELSVSTSPDFRDARIIHTRENSHKLYNLFTGEKYYWRVRSISGSDERISPTGVFYTKECARTIRIKGAYNIRDIGGYLTSSGKEVKQGLIYRSGDFDKIKSEGKGTIRTLGIRTQLDVRRAKEGKAGKKTTPVENYYRLRGVQYKSIWKNEKRKRRILRIMKVFADEDNYPIIMHCTYGRDRTGTLAFLINGLLGVSKKDLYRDYEMTTMSRLSSLHPRRKIRKFNALYKGMLKYEDPALSLQDNIKEYLVDIGMTREEISNIEEIMLEEGDQ